MAGPQYVGVRPTADGSGMKTLPTAKEIIAAHRIFQQVKRYEMAFVGQDRDETLRDSNGNILWTAITGGQLAMMQILSVRDPSVWDKVYEGIGDDQNA